MTTPSFSGVVATFTVSGYQRDRSGLLGVDQLG